MTCILKGVYVGLFTLWSQKSVYYVRLRMTKSQKTGGLFSRATEGVNKVCLCFYNAVLILFLLYLGNVQEASRLLGCKDVRVNCLDEVTELF